MKIRFRLDYVKSLGTIFSQRSRIAQRETERVFARNVNTPTHALLDLSRNKIATQVAPYLLGVALWEQSEEKIARKIGSSSIVRSVTNLRKCACQKRV